MNRLSSFFTLRRAGERCCVRREAPVDDRLEIGWLFAFYGPLLTQRQRSLLSLYCEEDFSLS